MFASKRQTESQGLNDAIDGVYREMAALTADDPAYAKMRTQVVELEKLKAELRPKRLSPDVLVTITGNILGIILIVGHERAHVVTSKALGFVRKFG